MTYIYDIIGPLWVTKAGIITSSFVTPVVNGLMAASYVAVVEFLYERGWLIVGGQKKFICNFLRI